MKDQARLWDDLRNVRRLFDLGQRARPDDGLTPCTAVVVRSSPLVGMTGTVVRAAGVTKFVV